MKVFTSVFLSLFIGGTALAGSNIKAPKYLDMQSSLQKLVSSHKKNSEFVTYGESIKKAPLNMVKIFNKSWTGTNVRPAVVITGAHHGWEYLNIADRLPEYLLTTADNVITNFISNGGIIYIVPIINPDGFNAWRRYNANEFDLNRDYPLQIVGHIGLSQPEIKYFLDYLLADIRTENAKIRLNLT